MLFLFAGTSEGRRAAKLLHREGRQFLCFVTTGQGAELLRKEGIPEENIRRGPLDELQIIELIDQQRPDTLIDATHPYAINISKSLITIAHERRLALVRIERPLQKYPDSDLIHKVPGITSAACLASELGQTIFLTIGSKAAGEFAKIALAAGKRIVTRVMPSEESIRKCLDAGFNSENILTGYGPFSTQDNIKDFQDHHVDVVVTKDSGSSGGVREKIDAAFQLGIKIVLIERPTDPYRNALSPNITIIPDAANLKV